MSIPLGRCTLAIVLKRPVAVSLSSAMRRPPSSQQDRANPFRCAVGESPECARRLSPRGRQSGEAGRTLSTRRSARSRLPHASPPGNLGHRPLDYIVLQRNNFPGGSPSSHPPCQEKRISSQKTSDIAPPAPAR